MTAPTHVTFAEFVYLLLLTTAGITLSIPNILAVAVSSVLPDIDTGASRVGKIFPFISIRIERKFGHRTLTHSLLGIALLAILLLPLLLLNRDLYACFIAGFATHPFLDTMTVSGVRLFYPFSDVRCVFPMDVSHPARCRTRTDSKVDKTLGVVFLIGCIPTFFVAEQGYERFIRITQHNIESAVRDYNEFSRTNLVYAEISAHNLISKDQISGQFEVLGTLNQHTLLFRGTDRRLHSLGNEYQSEYVAESVLCRKGEEARVEVRQIEIDNMPLREIQAFLDTTFENQFFGHLTTLDPFTPSQDRIEFTPISGSSGTLRLDYASYDDIRILGLEDLFVSRGLLTVRTIIPSGQRSASGRTGSDQFTPRFSRVTFEADAREPVEILCKKGDSVSTGQLLARWGHLLEIKNKTTLNVSKIALLKEQIVADLARAEENIQKARQKARSDSIASATSAALAQRGFASAHSAGNSGARYRQSLRELARLQGSTELLRTKTGIQIQRLTQDNERMAARQAGDSTRSEARSRVAGVVTDIRLIEKGSKLHGSVTIREK